MKEPGIVENGVLIGRNGYLFLAGGHHRVLDVVTGRLEIDDSSYLQFRQNIEGRIAWAAQNGAQFAHIVVPDRQSIIPEEWPLSRPLRIGEQYLKQMTDLSAVLIYPVNALSETRDRSVPKLDTHLTDYGSLLVASLVVEHLSGENQNSQIANFVNGPTRDVNSPGDLGSKLVPPVAEILQAFACPQPGLWVHNHVKAGNNGIVDLRFNPHANYKKRVVLFGDSFGRTICHFLQFWYSEVLFFRSGYFHREVATMFEPDVVLTENVERYFDMCLADTAAPNFFQYPVFLDKSYDPPEEFIQALADLLLTKTR